MRFFLLPIVFSFLLICANANNSKTDKEIPIIGWYGIPETQSTVERFKEQKESGINQNIQTYSNEIKILDALNAAQEAGVKLYVYSTDLLIATKSFAAKFKDHPALAGYYLQDEPSSTAFLDLKKLTEDIRSVDSTHVCYVNLYPMYASSRQLGVATYEEYVKDFISKVKPTILSFDFYPIIAELDSTLSVRKDWFENLEIISNQAKVNNIPFWAFVLATEHNNYPLPTLGQLRLQAFVNLAYGAQGIQYFTYWTPPGNTIEKFRNGPIDYEGNKTPTYYLIQKLNKQIKNLSFVFLNSEVLSTKHIDKNEKKWFDENQSLSKIFGMIETNGSQIFASYLQNGENHYLAIVNKNFQEEISIVIDTKVSFLKQVVTSIYSKKIKRGKNKLIIEPGNIFILSWTE